MTTTFQKNLANATETWFDEGKLGISELKSIELLAKQINDRSE